MTFPLLEHRHDAEGIIPLNLPKTEAGVPKSEAADFYGQTLEVANIVAIKPDNGKDIAHQSVLLEAQGLVHGDRNASYGHPLDDYTRTAGMVSSMLAGKLKEPLTPEDMILVMCCVKLSRQINRVKRDNLVDLAGYAECAQWVIDERLRRANESSPSAHDGA